MATDIKIPDMGTTADQVRLVAWHKKVGDSVKRGEVICDIETDKAVNELESIAEGIVLEILAGEDDELEQGAVIARVGKAGETVGSIDRETGTEKESDPDKISPKKDRNVAGIRISPMLKNLAEKLGADIETISGSGPNGAITKEDIENAAGKRPKGAGKLSTNQASVAKRVALSHQQIPPVNLTAEIDMAAAIKFREKNNVSFDAVFVFAAANIIKKFPAFRSDMDAAGKVTVDKPADIGIALGVGEELYTPVVRNASGTDIGDIDFRIKAFVEAARKGALTLSDMAGGAMTLSNLGMYPVFSFQVIIPPGQSSALAIGTVREQPRLNAKGKLEFVPALIATLSVDHRIINGRKAAEFLTELKNFIEQL
ncbi:MAG: dihydrolipoamide acetyltransferase family protein [Victivallaceae bacterium]